MQRRDEKSQIFCCIFKQDALGDGVPPPTPSAHDSWNFGC